MTVNNWIIIQQRINNIFSFDLPWASYKNGFGSPGWNYWMGNEKVYLLTNSGGYKLRIEMRSEILGWVSAEYSYFFLENEANWYRLHLGGFSGDCNGDSMQYSGDSNAFNQNGMYFTTSDSDHDNNPDINCEADRGGGWWYNSCNWANLNAHYNTYFYWWSLPDPYLDASRMMIKLV